MTASATGRTPGRVSTAKRLLDGVLAGGTTADAGATSAGTETPSATPRGAARVGGRLAARAGTSGRAKPVGKGRLAPAAATREAGKSRGPGARAGRALATRTSPSPLSPPATGRLGPTVGGAGRAAPGGRDGRRRASTRPFPRTPTTGGLTPTAVRRPTGRPEGRRRTVKGPTTPDAASRVRATGGTRTATTPSTGAGLPTLARPRGRAGLGRGRSVARVAGVSGLGARVSGRGPRAAFVTTGTAGRASGGAAAPSGAGGVPRTALPAVLATVLTCNVTSSMEPEEIVSHNGHKPQPRGQAVLPWRHV